MGLAPHIPSLQGDTLVELWHQSHDLSIVPVDGVSSVHSMFSNGGLLYSSNVANPCSVDMATTTMALLIALFGSLVMMT